MEIYSKGERSPRFILTDAEFADLLSQIFAFVEENSPNIKRASQRRWKNRFGKSVRSEAWVWLKGELKQKVSNGIMNILRRKQ